MAPKFRLANQHLFLTYKTHLDKKTMTDHLTAMGAVRVEICHESGKQREKEEEEKHPYLHTHIYVDFGKIFSSTRANIFDVKATDEKGEVENIHPNIAPIVGRGGVDKVLNYMSKEDPECIHLKKKEMKATIASLIWACQTRAEALALCAKPSDAPGILALYANKPTEVKEETFTPLPWQEDLMKKLEEKPNDRTVMWYYDEKGGCGKTRLGKWMHKNKKAYMVKALGGQYHTAPIIIGALDAGWDARVLIVDLTRSHQDTSIYDALEAIKDGVLTSTKYMGKTIDFDSPHVIVFANFLPETAMLSQDRWDIWHINRDDVGGYNITPHDWETLEYDPPESDLEDLRDY